LIQLKENGESIDLIGLQQSNSEDLFKMGGKEHLKEVYEYAISIHSFKHYETLTMQFTSIVEALAIVEEFKKQSEEVHRISYFRELLDKLNQIDVDSGVKEKTTYEKVKDRVEEHLNSPVTGLSGVHTGYKNVNNATDGWQPTDLIILAARPSMGKTANSLGMMWGGIEQDDEVDGHFFTAEMGDNPIIDRIIALEGGIQVNKMRNPNKYFNDRDWEKYRYALSQVEAKKNRFNLYRDKNVVDIRSRVRRLVTEQPNRKHVIYIDHLSHLKINGKYQSRALEVGAIVQELKDIAVDYKVPIILLCQLNRGVEKQQDKRPTLSDLRDSGEIEQIADMVLFIYREDYYFRNDPNYKKTNVTELIISKNRQGDLGTIYLKFQPENNRFVDV
jgi:replicative DNA helicase